MINSNPNNDQYALGYTNPGATGLDKQNIVNNTLSNLSVQNSINTQGALAAQAQMPQQPMPQQQMPVRQTKPNTQSANFIQQEPEPSQAQIRPVNEVSTSLEEKAVNPETMTAEAGTETYTDLFKNPDTQEKTTFTDDDVKNLFATDEEAVKDFYNGIRIPAASSSGMDVYTIKKTSEALIDPSNLLRDKFSNSDKLLTTPAIPNPHSHISGALAYAQGNGISNEAALRELNTMAKKASRNNDPEAGIKYFLATGEINNDAARKFASLMGRIALAVEEGKIKEEDVGKYLNEGYKNLTDPKGILDKIDNKLSTNPYLKDSVLYAGSQALGLLAGRALEGVVGKAANGLYKKLANSKGRVPNWLKQKIGVAADEEIKTLYNEQSTKTRQALYEKKNGPIPEFKTNDPYIKFKPEERLKFINDFLDEAEKAATSNKGAGKNLNPFSDIKLSKDAQSIMPTLEDLDIVDEATNVIKQRFPHFTSEDITACFDDLIKYNPDGKWGKALKKYRDFTLKVMEEQPDEFAAKYLDKVAKESVTEGTEARINAIDNAEYLLKHKDASRVMGDIIFRSIHPGYNEEKSGITDKVKNTVKGAAGKVADNISNAKNNLILGGAAAGKEGASLLNDKPELDNEKPEEVSAPEGVTENPIGLNSLAGGDGSYISYRGDKLEEPLTWEGREDYREVHDQLQADIKAAEEKGNITPEEAASLSRRVAMYNSFIRSIQNAPLNDVPNLIDAVEKAQGKVNDYSDKGMPKTWIGAYLSGEFGDPKSADAKRTLAYFALDSLGTALMNSAAIIQKRAPEANQWNKAQGVRLNQAYTRYDKAKTKAFENNLDSISKAMNLSIDQRNKVVDLMNEGDIKLLYDKLGDTRKIELLEKVARFAPYYNQLSDKQKAVMAAIMIDSGLAPRDELGLLSTNFSKKDIATLLGGLKNAEYLNRMYNSHVTQKQVELVGAQLQQVLQAARLTEAEANLYSIKVYAELADKGIDAAMRLINSLLPGGSK